MTFAEQFNPELDGYRAEWEAGVFRALPDAYELCVLNDLPLPDWLKEAGMDDLMYCYEHRQRGGAMARTGAGQDLIQYRQVRRHQLLKLLIQDQEMDVQIGLRRHPVNLTEAAKKAEAILRQGHDDARGSWRSILESYNSLETRHN